MYKLYQIPQNSENTNLEPMYKLYQTPQISQNTHLSGNERHCPDLNSMIILVISKGKMR